MKYVDHKGSRRPAWLRVVGLVVLIASALIVCAAVVAYLWYKVQLKPLTAESVQVSVTIPAGSTASDIAEQLATKRVVRSAFAFEQYVARADAREKLQAGAYTLDSAYSVPEIVEILTKGKVQRGLFTIVPGLRLDQIKAKMVASGFDAAAVDEALSANQYQNHPALIDKPADASLEGYLFPDSYERTANSTPTDIVKQALDEMSQALTDSRIERFKAQGLTTFEALTLASIVVKETSAPKDQPTVAGVFYNRLHINMMLGSDVTYQYIADVRGIERNANIDSPYNTRLYKGLPPGPISNVTLSSLDAVANPAKTDYLYFVAGDDGQIYYSRTQEEHERLAREHCIELCKTY